MTKNQDGIKVPAWVIGLLVPVLITLMSFTISASSRSQELRSDIDATNEKIERCKEDMDKKASSEKVDLVYETVLRLEEKLDEYIKEKN